MQEMNLDTLFAQGQIRLAEISVFNWGSFHNLHTARIDPEGTLITGDNGAGKSTLLDIISGSISPDSGRVDIGSTIKIGYFSQENAEMDEIRYPKTRHLIKEKVT